MPKAAHGSDFREKPRDFLQRGFLVPSWDLSHQSHIFQKFPWFHININYRLNDFLQNRTPTYTAVNRSTSAPMLIL